MLWFADRKKSSRSRDHRMMTTYYACHLIGSGVGCHVTSGGVLPWVVTRHQWPGDQQDKNVSLTVVTLGEGEPGRNSAGLK